MSLNKFFFAPKFFLFYFFVGVCQQALIKFAISRRLFHIASWFHAPSTRIELQNTIVYGSSPIDALAAPTSSAQWLMEQPLYNILKQENRLTSWLKAAKDINYIKRRLEVKVVENSISNKNSVGAHVYLPSEWSYGIRKIVMFVTV